MCNKYAAKFEQNATFYVVKGRILHNISACFTSQNTVFGQEKATFKGPFCLRNISRTIIYCK